MNTLDAFINSRKKNFLIPEGPVEQVNLLAEELALGVHNGLWGRSIGSDRRITDPIVRAFLDRRWRDIGDDAQVFDLLLGYDYIRLIDGDVYRHPLTRQAFDLLNQKLPYDVFISYRRSDSSALALLVQARLKEFGLVPFIDMANRAGDKWKDSLHERVRKCDYFVLLVGKNTLKSDMTREEIDWAIGHRKMIIPLWHNKFSLKWKQWDSLEDRYRNVIDETEAIRVKEESASGYNTAIVELLNRFGITP